MVAVKNTFPTPNSKSTKPNISVILKKSVRSQTQRKKNLSDDKYASQKNKDLQTTQAQNPTQVISLPQSKPLWLKYLMMTQFTSSIVTVLLTGTSVAFYGLTIYGQSKWTTEYQELQELREKEQQLNVANELLKNQIAEQASTLESDLPSGDSAKRIFLESAPPRPAPNPPQPYLESGSSHKYIFKTPVGY
ncbi:hypothetical protein [Okeania sp.]|uniref:hypothetical protein n=1 Tax=Okeania sp. TaxID=3100323 RepID=UPI002B4B47DC|nr:hypothetical protein [Okeania sp.]MEB3342968.1 hypothetical protein [Okeania sp.]